MITFSESADVAFAVGCLLCILAAIVAWGTRTVRR